MAAIGFTPAKKDVGRSLDQALTRDYPAALMIEGKPVTGILLENRGLRLFDLKKERIVAVGAEEKDDPAGGADTADADHLPSDVDDLVARQQLTTIEA
jgi:hypothetical protein